MLNQNKLIESSLFIQNKYICFQMTGTTRKYPSRALRRRAEMKHHGKTRAQKPDAARLLAQHNISAEKRNNHRRARRDRQEPIKILSSKELVEEDKQCFTGKRDCQLQAEQERQLQAELEQMLTEVQDRGGLIPPLTHEEQFGLYGL